MPKRFRIVHEQKERRTVVVVARASAAWRRRARLAQDGFRDGGSSVTTSRRARARIWIRTATSSTWGRRVPDAQVFERFSRSSQKNERLLRTEAARAVLPCFFGAANRTTCRRTRRCGNSSRGWSRRAPSGPYLEKRPTNTRSRGRIPLSRLPSLIRFPQRAHADGRPQAERAGKLTRRCDRRFPTAARGRSSSTPWCSWARRPTTRRRCMR